MAKDKMYVLGMFPYPSGEGLHVGHVRIYTAVDVIARYFRMKGYDVLHPMGWDAFGLPAENAAIKAKKNPSEMVPKNEANFKRQMQDLQFDFDWEREFSTTNPEYYGLTQWIFLKLYGKKNERGDRLVYRKEVPINWCPFCKTGLANEEVLPDGTHERCGNPVEKRDMPQWVMRITDYADRLLMDLDAIEWTDQAGKAKKGLDWPKGILDMQRNWIGKEKGLEIDFRLSNKETVTVWTKFWETVYGTTFLVVAPELAAEWMKRGWQAGAEVEAYVRQALNKPELTRQEGAKEKTGVKTDLTAVNPVNGEEVPVFVADYVLASVGTGAVMGVPAHDERDFEFAKKYDLPIIQVVSYDDKEIDAKVAQAEMSYEGEGKLVNSGQFDGMEAWGEGKKAMAEWMIEKSFGRWRTTYHLRDWIFSRQRYWGEPIPLVYCEKCGDENGVVAIPEDELPLKLPHLDSYEPTDTGESPLARADDWVNTTCPQCGGPAKRETDTMPNWAGSCWYFLAFPFWGQVEGRVRNLSRPEVQESIDKWMPVDWYLGGAEHAVLHLLYARFWVKALYDLGVLKFTEPFLRLRSVGMVLAEDGRKMSKSWGNVINPDEMVEKYGSDAVRLYEMFMGPWDQAIAWDTRTLVGQQRFIKKIKETFAEKGKIGKETAPTIRRQLYRLLHQVERGVVEQRFNTSISGMMEFINAWREQGVTLSKEDGLVFLKMIYPFAPKLAQELRVDVYQEKGGSWEWPDMGEVDLREVQVEVVVQVNGKVRGRVTVANGMAQIEEEVEKAALAEVSVANWVKGKDYTTVFVPGKIINFVIKQ